MMDTDMLPSLLKPEGQDETQYFKCQLRQFSSYLSQPRQDAAGMKKVFTRHLPHGLIFLKLQQAHRAFQTSV